MTDDLALLDRELYTESEAARLLGRSASTLHYWLHGGERRGRVYQPIIRPAVVDRRSLTWAEFIEAGWLSTYRQQTNVRMEELRLFIEQLRQRTGMPYPLAQLKPLVSGRNLVVEAQHAAALPVDLHLVVEVHDQYVLSYPGDMFLRRVIRSDTDLAVGWRVHKVESPVTVRPDVRFGRPSIGGISTQVVFESKEDGASSEEIASDFDLSLSDVRWALSYEEERHAA